MARRGFSVRRLLYPDRIANAHLADVGKVIDYVTGQSPVPVWLVGTSRGTISATASAIRWQPRVAGLVLTSSVVSYKKVGAVPRQDLAAIRLPVLVLHHGKDACALCEPHEVPFILRGLTNAPVKRLVMVDGGENPSGDACESQHWHGFVGMERQAVQTVTDWIADPR